MLLRSLYKIKLLISKLKYLWYLSKLKTFTVKGNKYHCCCRYLLRAIYILKSHSVEHYSTIGYLLFGLDIINIITHHCLALLGKLIIPVLHVRYMYTEHMNTLDSHIHHLSSRNYLRKRKTENTHRLKSNIHENQSIVQVWKQHFACQD